MLNKIGNYIKIIDAGINIIEKTDEFKNKITASSTLNQIIKTKNNSIKIDEEVLVLKEKMCRLLYLMKDEHEERVIENEKNSKNILSAVLLLNPYTSLGYAGYKGYQAIKKHNENIKEFTNLAENCSTFKRILESTGISEKMNDSLYVPTVEELEMLKEGYKMNTNGGDLVEMLIKIINAN